MEAAGQAGRSGPGAVRAIDVPIEDLPAVDERTVDVDASADRTWEALLTVLARRFTSPRSTRIATALRCAHTEPGGDLRHPGGTLPGFVVARAIPPAMLALLGAHRFSRYALVLRIDRLPGDRCVVRAETRAEFPGAAGRVYRAVVIGSRGHALVVRRLLRAVKRAAER